MHPAIPLVTNSSALCPAFHQIASSASPFVSAPARSPEGRAPCVVEIFAGSCNFSSTAVSMGFQSVAVDHVQAKRWHVLQLDLREPRAQQLLLSTCCRPWWCLRPRAALLPEQRIFQLTAMGDALRPLRSGQHPDGRCRWHVQPARHTVAYQELLAVICGIPQHSQTEVHFCAYAGARRKAHCVEKYSVWLQALCRIGHSHSRGSRLPTALPSHLDAGKPGGETGR